MKVFLNSALQLFATMNIIAIKVMDVIRENGLRVPEDISLVSFDDSQLAIASEIKFTTVAHPKEKLGEEAVNGNY